MITISIATDQRAWDAFLLSERFRPFLQSWTMGEVYRDVGEEPVRLLCLKNERIVGACQGIHVRARRGHHLAVLYGPVIENECTEDNRREALRAMINALKTEARKRRCAFLRLSPFWPEDELHIPGSIPSPLHALAEHVWYLPLVHPDPWSDSERRAQSAKFEEELFKNFRPTTRNLIRRAEKDGVTVQASDDPLRDLPHFLRLHEETRRRHGFTPYADAFFRAQVARFAARKECTLYLATFQGQIISASIHMHMGGETSYHHGASAEAFKKIPASYLLQWTAIRDALKRGDHVYNFWGIAPQKHTEQRETSNPSERPGWADEKRATSRHPFAGVTLFKTGYGGSLRSLMHCRDIPLSPRYALTYGIEMLRKWRRGF